MLIDVKNHTVSSVFSRLDREAKRIGLVVNENTTEALIYQSVKPEEENY